MEGVSFRMSPSSTERPESRLVQEGAAQMNFKLKARASHSAARTIQQALDQLAAEGSVKETAEGFMVEAEMDGASAKELNRTLLSALRKAQKRTTLRAEWTSSDGVTERFFDFVLRPPESNQPLCHDAAGCWRPWPLPVAAEQGGRSRRRFSFDLMLVRFR